MIDCRDIREQKETINQGNRVKGTQPKDVFGKGDRGQTSNK